MLQSVGIIVLRILAFTWRYSIHGEQPLPLRTCIIVFWHEHMLAGWHAHRLMKSTALVSLSKDGEILSRILKGWGISTIRGSSSQAGKEALENMIEHLENGTSIMLTPDGPRGPRHIFKPGAAIASIRTNTPLFLTYIKEEHAVIFKKSWDQFKLPLPFSKVHLHYKKVTYIGDSNSKDLIADFIAECESIMKEER